MSTPKTVRIDLGIYQTSGAKVFTGRPRGRSVRSLSKLDELEISNDKIIISIPKTIESINPSFLEELFFNVVRKLGKEKFYEKFSFENEGEYQINDYLEEAIDRILEDQIPL